MQQSSRDHVRLHVRFVVAHHDRHPDRVDDRRLCVDDATLAPGPGIGWRQVDLRVLRWGQNTHRRYLLVCHYHRCMDGPLPRWCDDTCGICPAQVLGPGAFDVVERPACELAYNPSLGWRATPAGIPVCVHPFRCGMRAGRYATAGDPLPDLTSPLDVAPPPEVLQVPESLEDLSAWMVAHLRLAGEDQMVGVVARLERVAGQRFAPGEVIAVLRRVLSVELART